MAEAKDWQVGKTLPGRLHHMLTNDLMCDVTFLVGPQRTPIKAHKCMLASASPVFYSMFDCPMAEQGDVTIPDLEVDAFKHILKFIYTDEVDVNANNIKGLTYGSDKYIIQGLKEKCTSFLTANVDKENVCVVLQTAYDFHLDTLKDEALEFILKTGRSCLESNTFLTLSPDCVKLIIESDDLCCTEEVVYETMIKWSNVRCQELILEPKDENIRKVLGDLLYLIRFPVMDRKYFTTNISKKSLLSSDEKVEVYQSYDSEYIKSFLTLKRHHGDIRFLRCEVDRLGIHWSHAGAADCLDFSTTFDAYLSGIYVFGSNTYFGQHDVNVDLLQSGVTLGSVSTKLNSTAGEEIYLIKFNDFILVDKNKRYTIQLLMTGPDVFRGKNYNSTVTAEIGSVSFQTCHFRRQTAQMTVKDRFQEFVLNVKLFSLTKYLSRISSLKYIKAEP